METIPPLQSKKIKWRLGDDSDDDIEYYDYAASHVDADSKLETISNNLDYFIVNIPASNTHLSKRYKILNSIFVFLQYIFAL
jgi:hypothetical protein